MKEVIITLLLASRTEDANGVSKLKLVGIFDEAHSAADIREEVNEELGKAIGRLKKGSVRKADVLVLQPVAVGVAHIETEFMAYEPEPFTVPAEEPEASDEEATPDEVE